MPSAEQHQRHNIWLKLSTEGAARCPAEARRNNSCAGAPLNRHPYVTSTLVADAVMRVRDLRQKRGTAAAKVDVAAEIRVDAELSMPECTTSLAVNSYFRDVALGPTLNLTHRQVRLAHLNFAVWRRCGVRVQYGLRLVCDEHRNLISTLSRYSPP